MSWSLKSFLPPIFGGKKTLGTDLRWAGDQLGNAQKNILNTPNWLINQREITGAKSQYYPTGKATIGEILSPSGYKKGAEFLRGGITKRAGATAEGLVGTGAYSWLSGNQGIIPNWGWKPNGQGTPTPVLDTSGKQGGLVNITVPPINIPPIKLPDLPDMSGFDLSKLKLPDISLPPINLPPVDLSGVKMPDLNIAPPEIKLPSLISGGDGQKSDIPLIIGIGAVLMGVFLLEGKK